MQPRPVFNPSAIIGVSVVSAVAILFMVFTLLDGVFRSDLPAEQKARACTQYLVDHWGYNYQPVPKMDVQMAPTEIIRDAIDPSTAMG